jgi:hypothetical protein
MADIFISAMLGALWVNLEFDDGATAEGLVPNLPSEVRAAEPRSALGLAAVAGKEGLILSRLHAEKPGRPATRRLPRSRPRC